MCEYGNVRRGHVLGPVVNHFAFARVGDDLEKGLGRFDIRAADHLPLAGRVATQTDLREVRGRLIILILRPALERMVMALVAIEPHRQEELGRILHGRRRVAEDLEVRRRRVLPVRAVGRHDRPDELVVRCVGGDV